MDRFTRALAAALGHAAGLLPASRREWVRAVQAEAADVPAGMRRVAWLCGGLGLVAREVVVGRVMWALAFAVGAAGLVWVGWPGASTNSATPLNRVYVVGTVVMLAVLPWAVRRYVGPVRAGWAPRAARAGGYVLVLALIAAKIAKDRDGSKLGRYFVIVPGLWSVEILLLLVIIGYVAGLLILTSAPFRPTRWVLPASMALSAVTAVVLHLDAPLGASSDPSTPSLKWWGLAALALPIVAGVLAGQLAARDKRPGAMKAVQQGCLAASCALAAAGLMVAVLTSATIALFPHQVPLAGTAAAGGGPDAKYIAGGGCETCDPNRTVIPRGLRHEYWVEISVGQAGMSTLAFLFLAPFLGAGLGVIAGGLGGRLPGSKGRAGGPDAASPPEPSQPLVGAAAEVGIEPVAGLLKPAFETGPSDQGP
jgi:hypothetical protein